MKSQIRFYLIPLVLLSAFFSCTKEVSRETGGKTVSNSDFYASIDGKLWNADSLQLILVSASGVAINGLSKTGEQISMILPSFKTGTYSLNSASVSYALYANLLDNVSDVFASNTGQAAGTVTISAIDSVNHLVSGTFQFTLVNPIDNSVKTITKGVFDFVPYSGSTGTTPPPGSGGTDTLTAQVDGVSFIAAQVEATVTPPPNGGPDQLLITGIAANGTEDIGLLIPAAIGAGTYNLDFASGQYIGIYYPSGGTNNVLLSVANGTLTIISNDTVAKRIKGIFNFVATSLTSSATANITQGYFALSY
jgi:Family of unknown function (DUF6252)